MKQFYKINTGHFILYETIWVKEMDDSEEGIRSRSFTDKEWLYVSEEIMRRQKDDHLEEHGDFAV
jgi:hypothetical protein